MVTIIVDTDQCKGCRLCIVNCPKDVLEQADESSAKGYYPSIAVRPEDCNVCRICERVCPDLAISVHNNDK